MSSDKKSLILEGLTMSRVNEADETEHIEEVKKGVELLLKKYKIKVKWSEDSYMVYTTNSGLSWKGRPVQFEIYKDSGNLAVGFVGSNKGGYGLGYCSSDAKTLASKLEKWLGITTVLNFEGLE